MIIFRRKLLQRDPPYDFKAALEEISQATGWGVPDLAFILNVSRGCIRGLWEGARPSDDLGQAIRKLRATYAIVEAPEDSGLSIATTEGEVEA